MQTSKLNDLLQILASCGVLVGLFVVAYELKQNTTIAAAEQSRETFTVWTDVAAINVETDIGMVVIKSVDQPDNLTAEELFRLNAWYVMILSIYASNERADDLGVSAVTTIIDEPYANYLFASRYSRHWFERNKWWLGARNVEVISRVIQTTPVATEWQRLGEYYSSP